MSEYDPVATLTPAQKEVLRLVARGMSSKEIAARLTISVPAVDDRVEGARAKLGGVRRMIAARLLAEAEAGPKQFGGNPEAFRVSELRDTGDEARVADDGGDPAGRRIVFEPTRPTLLIDRLNCKMISGLIVVSALAFLLFLALLKPMIDSISWVVAATERFFR